MKAVPSFFVPAMSLSLAVSTRNAICYPWKSRPQASLRWAMALGISVLAAMGAKADAITTNDIVPIPQHVAGSGNGTLELRM